jgi:hypothetical protein
MAFSRDFITISARASSGAGLQAPKLGSFRNISKYFNQMGHYFYVRLAKRIFRCCH